MSILVDSSIWVEYFRTGKNHEQLDIILDENLVVTNDLILAELLPFLKLQNQRKVINLLKYINKLPLTINWDQIIDFQYKCLKKGMNGIGIPDLIIAQNALQNHCTIFSTDRHFTFLAGMVDINIM